MGDVTLNRSLRPSDIKCEAGTLVGDASCRCNIEQHTIHAYLEPNTIDFFCAGDPTACSTWMAAKKVEHHGGDLRKILAAQQQEASQRRSRKMLREARLRRAQKLLTDPGPEGKKFRQALKIGEYAQAVEIAGGE